MTYSRRIGIIRIHSDKTSRPWFEKLRSYLGITHLGVLPYGRPDGEDHIYWIKGKKIGRSHQTSIRRRDANRRTYISPGSQIPADTADS